MNCYRSSNVIDMFKLFFFLFKMIYIRIRFFIGNILGEKIERFYNSYPIIIQFLIVSANLGKLTQLLDNNNRVNLHMKCEWQYGQVITPIMLAVQKQDMKILCTLICYDEKIMKLAIQNMKNNCIKCNREERQAVALCQHLVKKKYDDHFQSIVLRRLQNCLDCQQAFIHTLMTQENTLSSFSTTYSARENTSLSKKQNPVMTKSYHPRNKLSHVKILRKERTLEQQ